MKTITQKTIKQILIDGSRFLEERGNVNARAEAERLVSFVLRIERAQIYLDMDRPLIEKEINRLRSLFITRSAGKPLQYILGESSFRYLSLKVDENVLIPRQETELIVELVAKKVKENSKILELGTGSGAIAISIAKELGVDVEATDVSIVALEIAKTNALLNKVENINWTHSSWFENIDLKYDFIISNPPYVSAEEFETLAKEIRMHEPPEAVTDNADGLKCLRHIIKETPAYLNNGGYLVLEIGHTQQKPVQNLLTEAAFKNIVFEKDLSGIDRFAIAQLLSS